jgi:hypothetical protein
MLCLPILKTFQGYGIFLYKSIKKMKLNKKEVSLNLRLFGYKKFGSMKKFAEALDMNPSTLYSGYLNARSLPGPSLLVKLIDLGCNINWLLTSRETPFLVSKTDDNSFTVQNRLPSDGPKNIFIGSNKKNGSFTDVSLG